MIVSTADSPGILCLGTGSKCSAPQNHDSKQRDLRLLGFRCGIWLTASAIHDLSLLEDVISYILQGDLFYVCRKKIMQWSCS